MSFARDSMSAAGGVPGLEESGKAFLVDAYRWTRIDWTREQIQAPKC